MLNFTQWLEVQSHHLDKLGKKGNKIPENMNNVFGNKLRIAITLDGHEDPIHQFIRLVKDATQHQLTTDEIRNGTVTQTIQTQQGTKDRTITIGNLLKKHNKQDLMTLWSQVKDRIQHTNDDNYSIIISRSPIDLLRMSDHVHADGHKIQSCHSPNGGWFHCAIQEAKTGGAIAYAVKTDDLNDVKLQNKEIFTDIDRKQAGIIPIERLRLRRFTNGDTELLIPELRSYPASNYLKRKSVPGFKEAVVKWAKEAQQGIISQLDPNKDFKDFQLRGGSYQDNEAGDLWSSFFDTQTSGTKRSIDQQSQEDKENYIDSAYWDEEARHYHTQHHQNWANAANIKVDWDAHDQDEGNAYGSWSGNVKWELDLELFTKTVGLASSQTLGKELVAYFHSAGYREINRFKFVVTRYDVEVRGYMEQGEVAGELEEFESFLDDVDKIDQEYEDIENYIKAFLANEGFMTTPITQKFKEIQFKHFTSELNTKHVGGTGHYFLRSSKIPIGSLNGYPSHRQLIAGENGSKIALPWDVINHELHLPIPLPKEVIIDRQAFIVMYESLFKPGQSINTLTFRHQPLPATDFAALLLSFQININDEPEDVNNIFAIVKQLDDHFDEITQHLQLWWKKLIPAIQAYAKVHYPYIYTNQ